MFQEWRRQFSASIKAREAEDQIDLWFYRPLGFLIAKACCRIGLSPTQVTLLGMASGIGAGIFFARAAGGSFAIAVGLFLLSGILDSADGQLARLTGRSTPFGLVVDGLCDNIVFISVYVGCGIPAAARFGWGIWPLAVAAGFAHSLESSMLDFYLREYLFFTGTRDDYWNPSPDDARAGLASAASARERWQWRLRASWLFQQSALSVREPRFRAWLRERRNSSADGSFALAYRRENLRLLHLWRPLGANVHTLGIIVFAALGRFELYLLLVDLAGLGLLFSVASWAQFRADRRLAARLGGRSFRPLEREHARTVL